MERPKHEVWDEIVRTAKLVQSYDHLFEDVAHKTMFSELTGEDALRLVQVVSDAQILARLVCDLDSARPRIT